MNLNLKKINVYESEDCQYGKFTINGINNVVGRINMTGDKLNGFQEGSITVQYTLNNKKCLIISPFPKINRFFPVTRKIIINDSYVADIEPIYERSITLRFHDGNIYKSIHHRNGVVSYFKNKKQFALVYRDTNYATNYNNYDILFDINIENGYQIFMLLLIFSEGFFATSGMRGSAEGYWFDYNEEFTKWEPSE